jgi:Flp pilus assembly protein CpaB
MKKVNLILLTVVLVAVLLAAEVVIVKSAVKYEPTANIVYAKVNILAQKEITSEMLCEKKINISLAHSQSFRSMKDLTGKKAKVDITAGEMILSGKLGKANEMEPIEVKDKNSRLFTVEFKGDQANGWWIKVGQYVDIIYVPNDKPKAVEYVSAQAKDQPTVRSSQTAGNAEGMEEIKRLNNIRVAALIDEKGNQLKNTNRETLPRYISFEVTDKQVQLLAYAKSNGRLEVSVIPEN